MASTSIGRLRRSWRSPTCRTKGEGTPPGARALPGVCRMERRIDAQRHHHHALGRDAVGLPNLGRRERRVGDHQRRPDRRPAIEGAADGVTPVGEEFGTARVADVMHRHDHWRRRPERRGVGRRVQQVDASMPHGLRQSHQRPSRVGRQVKRLRDAFGALGCRRRRIPAQDHEVERLAEACQRPQQLARVAPDARGGRGQGSPVEANTQARPHRETGSACDRLRGMRQP